MLANLQLDMSYYLLNDIPRFDICHTHFTGHVHMVVLGNIKPGRPQTIPVQYGTDVTPIGEGQQSYSNNTDLLRTISYINKIFNYQGNVLTDSTLSHPFCFTLLYMKKNL